MFVTGGQAAAPSPSQPGLSTGLRLIRAERRTFAGPAGFLDDPANRADLETYLTDLTRAYPELGPLAAADGQSYGEMAEALIGAVTAAEQPVDLLVLAYAIHDMQPGRATATYLSHVCPGAPLSFAICDQGSATAFSGLRIARDYLASAGSRRTLLIVVEQAMLPYASGAAQPAPPAQHRGVAMLFESGLGENGQAENEPLANGQAENGPQGNALPEAGRPGGDDSAERKPAARLVALRQRPNLAAGAVAGQAGADLAELSAGYRGVRLVLSPALAAAWPAQDGQVRVGPADQPSTSAWWQLLAELDEIGALSGPDRPDLLVVADFDTQLGYLCLAAIEPG